MDEGETVLPLGGEHGLAAGSQEGRKSDGYITLVSFFLNAPREGGEHFEIADFEQPPWKFCNSWVEEAEQSSIRIHGRRLVSIGLRLSMEEPCSLV